MKADNFENIIFASFKKRLFAGLVDYILFVPILIFPYTINSWSKFGFISNVLITQIICFSYSVFMVGKYGQTIGKMIFKIKILKSDNTKATYLNALLRVSVDIFLSALMVYGILEIISGIPETYFDNTKYVAISKYLYELKPSNSIHEYLNYAWGINEFITMFFNKHRQSFNDLIANTVVIDIKTRKNE